MKLMGKENYKLDEIVYGIPYGNYTRYGKNEITRFKIIKIGNKYAELQQEGSHRISKCTMSEGRIEEFNAGYYIYASEQEIENEKRRSELYRIINNEFDAFIGNKNLSLDQLERIYAICQE